MKPCTRLHNPMCFVVICVGYPLPYTHILYPASIQLEMLCLLLRNPPAVLPHLLLSRDLLLLLPVLLLLLWAVAAQGERGHQLLCV